MAARSGEGDPESKGYRDTTALKTPPAPGMDTDHEREPWPNFLG